MLLKYAQDQGMDLQRHLKLAGPMYGVAPAVPNPPAADYPGPKSVMVLAGPRMGEPIPVPRTEELLGPGSVPAAGLLQHIKEYTEALGGAPVSVDAVADSPAVLEVTGSVAVAAAPPARTAPDGFVYVR